MTRYNTENLLSLPEAKEKSRLNQKKILKFLYAEKYSTSRILKELVGIKTRSGMCRLLRKMEKQKMIKKHQYSYSVVLWGITYSGIHEAIESHEEITDWTYFEPSKVHLSTLEHQLAIQQLHVICIRQNLPFKAGRTLGSRATSDKIPDGIITIGNTVIPCEIENHIKSRKRYDGIIYNYLKGVKAGKYDEILYIAPTPKKRDQIKKVFLTMKKITMTINGRKVPLKPEPEKHLGFFHFICLQDVETYLTNLKIIRIPQDTMRGGV
jgi:hypothetical protein